ncbi:MAG: C45 family autoproteolytic acyltransferase/hydrolase [Desulfobacterales bacterium]|nr:C45 family autoproteolytic acyltransferase/hydrolase [Desulfobacterales bacterium]
MILKSGKQIEQFEVSGSHYEVGLAIGSHFARAIHRFFDNYERLQRYFLPFYQTSTGMSCYQSFLDLHRARFPAYMRELEGIAEGANRPFKEVFLVNLRGEFSGLLSTVPGAGENGEEGCTDCLVLTADAALIGHNEDGSPAAASHMYVIKVNLDSGSSFTALSYPGFLPGNAFGYNAAGILHTADHVAPQPIKIGAGRHFLARSLLEAGTLEEAVRNITAPDRASGFNYNIGSLSDRKILSVEVSPERHHIHEVRGCYTHTNHYIQLTDQKQEITQSSQKRLTHSRALGQTAPKLDAAIVLSVLGDRTDPDYPIHRDASPPDDNATLCSALFDLDQCSLKIYPDHPLQQPDSFLEVKLI